jgi:radical SAM superfamily enzyme YgiQ (UPF0313 family)
MTEHVVIVSVPYNEMVPAMAPALLSACLNNAGIKATGVDLSIEFATAFVNKPYWNNLKLFLSSGAIDKDLNYFRPTVDTLKFIKKKLIAIKKEFDPTIIGLSIFTAESINFSYFLIPYIRKYIPDVKIMLGGRGLESNCNIEHKPHYKKYIDHGLADIVIVGDAETEIIRAIKSKSVGLIFSASQTSEDLDNIPSPDWSNYNFDYYKQLQNIAVAEDKTRRYYDPRSMVITASKGCVRNCSFCDVPEYWPKYIFRRGENVAADIIDIYHKTGNTNFEFTDNLINGSIPNYRKMNQLLVEKIPKTIRYGGYAIFRDRKSMPEYDFELAGQAGCYRWSIGVESGSESVRKHMRKNFSNDDLDYGVHQLHKNGIMQSWSLIVGYPSETDKDFNETIELLDRSKKFNKNGMIRLAITLPFQLNDIVPLTREQKFIDEFQWNDTDAKNPYSRYFWTTVANPHNTFDVRYHRYKKIIESAIEFGYTFFWVVDLKKHFGELEDLKKIYDQNRKKIIYISQSK